MKSKDNRYLAHGYIPKSCAPELPELLNCLDNMPNLVSAYPLAAKIEFDFNPEGYANSPDHMERVAEELNKLDPTLKAAQWHTGGGIYCINVVVSEEVRFTIGNPDVSWGGDLVNGEGDFLDRSWSLPDLASAEEEAVTVARGLFEFIERVRKIGLDASLDETQEHAATPDGVRKEVVKLIQERAPEWKVTFEFQSNIHVQTPQDGMYVFGTINETWDGDVMLLDGEQGDVLEVTDEISTQVSSRSRDAEAIASAIIEAITSWKKR
jgi:hypothetical protein